MSQVDRTEGLVGNTGIKAPCRLASTANLPSLSGLLVVNGQTTVADDRVLLTAQTDGTQNGIWAVSSSAWNRADDFDGAYDVARGTLITVNEGTNAGYWSLTTTTTPLVIGTTSLAFSKASTPLADLALDSGSVNVGHIDTGTDAVATTVGARLHLIPYVTDFPGVVADGTTDNTADILAACIGSGHKVMLIPPKVKYDRVALLDDATMPKDVVLLDFSMINDYTAAGETTNHFGLVHKGEGVNDTAWSMDSWHHPYYILNNFGGSSASGLARKASLLWAVGQYALGSANKRGYRTAAIMQFSNNDYSAGFWTWHLRSLAPSASITGKYELWAQGQVISGAGVYRVNDDYHYVSTGAGTTGATPPTHSTGTVSDGGVSWTHLDSVDRSLIHIRSDGRVLMGQGDFSAHWRIKVPTIDSIGTFIGELEATGVSKNVLWKLIPTNATGAGVATAVPYLQATAVDGLLLMKSDGSTALASINDTQGLLINREAASFITFAPGSEAATVDLRAVSVAYFTWTTPTSITALTMNDGQKVECHFANGNVTFTNGSSLRLAGAANFTPGDGDVITFRKYPNSISARVVEIYRSNN